MKLIRLGKKDNEKVAVLDSNNKFRDLSSYVEDLNPDTINFKLLEDLNSIKFENLPELKQSERIGSCISRPGDFLAVGLNYKAHAEGTKSKLPTEPIL